jgi:hypothetical protein
VEAVGSESTPRGPTRTLLRGTPRGSEPLAAWLGAPLTHFREVRVELLLKLALLDRLGGDPRPLLCRQRELFTGLQAFIERGRAPEPGFDGILAAWRQESAAATMRFLDRAIAGDTAAGAPQGGRRRQVGERG